MSSTELQYQQSNRKWKGLDYIETAEYQPIHERLKTILNMQKITSKEAAVIIEKEGIKHYREHHLPHHEKENQLLKEELKVLGRKAIHFTKKEKFTEYWKDFNALSEKEFRNFKYLTQEINETQRVLYHIRKYKNEFIADHGASNYKRQIKYLKEDIAGIKRILRPMNVKVILASCRKHPTRFLIGGGALSAYFWLVYQAVSFFSSLISKSDYDDGDPRVFQEEKNPEYRNQM